MTRVVAPPARAALARAGPSALGRRPGRAVLALARLLALAITLPLAGCGDESRLKVSAAASLEKAFRAYDRDAAYSFAGSDELAAQVRAGARPDVIASADERLPAQLFAAGLVERPVPFAANRLVLAVPARGRVRALADAGRPGTKLVVGSPTVPVGVYAGAAIARLPIGLARALRRNVRSREPDARAIVAKLARGAGDAGLVYATDVRATRGALRAVELPLRARLRVVYAAAVVRGSRRATAARAYVTGLRTAAGRRALLRAGFRLPPRS